MKISVIVPAYNAEKTIAEALDSIRCQTHPVDEIIVVDDGSTDDTTKIIKNYQPSAISHQPIIKYIYQSNSGPAAARNRGISEASGDWIAFLDADDLWSQRKIEKQTEFLAAHPQYVLCFTDMEHVEEGRRIHRSYLHERNYRYAAGGRIYQNLLNENFIFTPTVLVRKDSLIAAGGFDENYKICEDYKLWLTLARHHEIGFIDEPLVIRRRITTNITGDRFLFAESHVRLFEELKRQDADAVCRIAIDRRLKKNYYELGYHHWHRGEQKEARRYFLKSFGGNSQFFRSLAYIAASFFPPDFIRRIRGRNHV